MSTETKIELTPVLLASCEVRDYVATRWPKACADFGSSMVRDWLADRGFVSFNTAGFVDLLDGAPADDAVTRMREYGWHGVMVKAAKGGYVRTYLRGLAMQQLRTLPDKPRDIAEFLHLLGQTGMPHVSGCCPVSNWLTEATGFACYVGDSQVTWYGSWGHVSITMPDALAAFVYEFDREGYPDLVSWIVEQQHRMPRDA